jgi:NAD(P)-dependent dehydrogenase (short-subunit alcohol dehydrogenase family)
MAVEQGSVGRGHEVPVVVVTGSSGSIGRATVAAAGARGAGVVALDRSPAGPGVHGAVLEEVLVDLLDDRAVGDAFASLARHGPLRHVVCVAGGGDAGELGDADPATEDLDVFARVVAANLHVAFVAVRHSVPLLRDATGDRSITLVGSINAFGGYGAPGYSAAKAGLSGLVRALAPLLGRDGVRINCLAPGTVDTENLHALAQATDVPLDLTAVAEKAPLRRVLTPGDVAAALVAMAFDLRGLTGATITLDNGQTLIR